MILKIEGFVLKDNYKEKLEILIFKGFSSSTNHPIEIDFEKKVIELPYVVSNFKLLRHHSQKTKIISLEKIKTYFLLKSKYWI